MFAIITVMIKVITRIKLSKTNCEFIVFMITVKIIIILKKIVLILCVKIINIF